MSKSSLTVTFACADLEEFEFATRLMSSWQKYKKERGTDIPIRVTSGVALKQGEAPEGPVPE